MDYKAIPLVMKCPGTGCTNPDVIKYWTHQACSKQVYLQGNGHIVCIGCCTYPLMDWRFACKLHTGDYRKPDYMAVCNGLGAAMASVKSFFINGQEAIEFLQYVQTQITKHSYGIV